MNVLGCLLGLQTDNFVMLAADTSLENVLVHILSDVVKIIKVGEKVGIAGIGIAADRANFLRDLAIEFEFFKVRNHRELQLESAVHFVNKQLIKASNAKTMQLYILVGGYMDDKGYQLHYLDGSGGTTSIPYMAQGIGGKFCETILKLRYRPDLNQAEVLSIFGDCVVELNKRSLFNFSKLCVAVIDENGFKYLKNIELSKCLVAESIKNQKQKEQLKQQKQQK
ncbi:proteasome subunit beta type-2-like [Teleopsis dalmanni]|uniref:proteasome subunit beta type-2-like n=1 Tax=Teleopsis dalmanni TaxID=139649 RepID=UPI0018CD3B2E|nr:proteasome subunit beta type-2-like [Teleopsis dalmanni]